MHTSISRARIIVALILAVLLALGAWHTLNSHSKAAPLHTEGADYLDATYQINGTQVSLAHGVSRVPSAPGSASETLTRYFGNAAESDLNGDGRKDVVFLLTQETGGTGTFFYAVAALNTVHGYEGSEAYFLGDRIAPQTTDIGPDGVINVNYADRGEGESFAAQPSIGKTVRLRFDLGGMRLVPAR